MRKLLCTVLLSMNWVLGFAQSIFQDNVNWRNNQNAEFRDSAHSPLTREDRLAFDSLSFFPINEKFYIKAIVTLTPDSLPFKMKTSTDRLPDYRQWAIASFELDGKQFSLPIYQNLGLMQKMGYDDYLFIPFTDLTNGISTYGGGRYTEARIPQGDTLIIDFNKAYNPYCAYNHRYSCPIPPAANHLDIEINAGEKAFESLADNRGTSDSNKKNRKKPKE